MILGGDATVSIENGALPRWKFRKTHARFNDCRSRALLIGGFLLELRRAALFAKIEGSTMESAFIPYHSRVICLAAFAVSVLGAKFCKRWNSDAFNHAGGTELTLSSNE